MALEKEPNKLSVNLVLIRTKENGKKEILLQLRKNTGYFDNFYDFACSGHVENKESFTDALLREAQEEIGIKMEKKNIKFLMMNHQFLNGYVQTFFTTEKYTGTPTICEKDKCEKLAWFDIEQLPTNIIPYVKNAIDNIMNGVYYDEFSK